MRGHKRFNTREEIPGTVSRVDYNHYSMLRSFEDIFGLFHLGNAAMPQVKAFGPDVYTNP